MNFATIGTVRAALVVATIMGGVNAIGVEARTLESDALEVRVADDGGIAFVRDKRSGRVWGEDVAEGSPRPGEKSTLTFVTADAQARYRLDGAELLVEAAFETLPNEGRVFPQTPAFGADDAFVIPFSEGFRIPVAECDLVTDGEIQVWRGGLSMPLFGVVDERDECGWMAILETPEDAVLKCVGADGHLASVSPMWKQECGKAGYPRRVRFVFFDKGGYVAMAKRYRAYAAEQGLVKTFREKAKERPLVERLPGAANVWYFPYTDDPPHSTVAEELRDAGIDRFLWSSWAPKADVERIAAMPDTLVGRYDVCRDVYYPELLDAIGRDNPPKSEICNNTSAWPDDIAWDRPDSNAWRRAWGSMGKDGKKYYCAAQCDIPAIARLERLAGTELAEVPFTARFIDVVSAIGWEECYNPAHPMTRRVSRQAKTDLLKMLCEKFSIVVGGEQGMDAFVPVCDYFEGMMSPTCARMPHGRPGYWRRERFRDDGTIPAALSTNEWDRVERYALNEKYRIPLFELVYHDCVASHWYWYDYSNCPVYYWWKRDLFNALYGTAPMYIFDYRQWRERKEEFVESWKRVGGIAREAGFSEMTSHRALTEDRSVQETCFANGLSVTVDFRRRTVEVSRREDTGSLTANLVGAQITSWRPAALDGGEVLFMDQDRPWGDEVHGGIPICWPWLGGRKGYPSHGIVRFIPWRLATPARGGALAFETWTTSQTKAWWPYDFHLRAEMSMSSPDSLEVAITETNTGSAPFDSAFGFHTYFSVSDAEGATLDGKPVPPPDGSTLKFAADGKEHVLGDPARGREYAITCADADKWYLWNAGAKATYVAPGEWRHFFCLEPLLSVLTPLAPGESRTYRATFRVHGGIRKKAD